MIACNAAGRHVRDGLAALDAAHLHAIRDAFASVSRMAPPSTTSSTQSIAASNFRSTSARRRCLRAALGRASTRPSRTMFRMSLFSSEEPTTRGLKAGPAPEHGHALVYQDDIGLSPSDGGVLRLLEQLGFERCRVPLPRSSIVLRHDATAVAVQQ